MAARHIDTLIARVASRQASVVHARDLRAIGVSRGAVASRIANGTMAELLPRTYGVGPMCSEPTHEMRCMAAVLRAGRAAVLDGVTAAVLQDAWNRPNEEVHVTATGRFLPAPHPYVFHRAGHGWTPGRAIRVGVLPVVGFREMCVQLSRQLTPWQLAFVIDRGRYLERVTLAELEAVVAELAAVPWMRTLRGALELARSGSVGTRCMTEDELLAGLLAAGIDVPIVNTRGIMGIAGDEPDMVWRDARLDVELDGRQHAQPHQASNDAGRDAAARTLDWRVLRFWSRDVWTRRDDVVRAIGSVLEGAPVSSISFRRSLEDEP